MELASSSQQYGETNNDQPYPFISKFKDSKYETVDDVDSEFRVVFADREALDNAITAWMANETSATETYGDINTWDVGAITDFSRLFENKTKFNSDISNWNVSSVTTFSQTFKGCTNFNQNIGNWDTSSLKNSYGMFINATVFNFI